MRGGALDEEALAGLAQQLRGLRSELVSLGGAERARQRELRSAQAIDADVLARAPG